jgi:hypothetical protein
MGDMSRPRHMQLKTAEISRGGGFSHSFILRLSSRNARLNPFFLWVCIDIVSRSHTLKPMGKSDGLIRVSREVRVSRICLSRVVS